MIERENWERGTRLESSVVVLGVILGEKVLNSTSFPLLIDKRK